jgi:hypothetical protein
MNKNQAARMLGQYYGAINRRAYKGKLPRRRRFILSELRDELAYVERNQSGPVFHIHKRLLFSRKLLVRELVHEIVHVAHPRMGHGIRFEAEMLRIRRRMGGDQLW